MVQKTCKHKMVYTRETETHIYYKCEKCKFTQGRRKKTTISWAEAMQGMTEDQQMAAMESILKSILP